MELHPFLEQDIRPSPSWWYVLSTNGESPSMRVGHSATFVRGNHADESGRIFIIGGANPSQVFDEVWVLDLETRSWDMLESPGFRGRYEHTAFQVESHSGKIFIFGGATQTGCLNDIQSLDTSTGTWSDVEVSGTLPEPRTLRSGGVVGNKIYFFGGGHSGAEPVSDRNIQCLDTETWTWTALTPRGNPPKARHGHLVLAVNGGINIDGAAAGDGNVVEVQQGKNCHKNSGLTKTTNSHSHKENKIRPGTADSNQSLSTSRIYVHGGMSGATFFDDLHVFDVDKMSWNLVRKKRTSPPPRTAHEGIVYNNQFILFGGMSQAGALDDAYRFNPEGNSWTKLEFEGPAPPNRLDFAMCHFKLKVPTLASSSEGSEAQFDLSEASASTRAVLERELKPGSASSRDSVSDSTSVDEALYTLESGECPQGQTEVTARVTGDTSQTTENGPQTDTEEVDLILVHGGMDTEGEIFDDTLVLLLSN